VPEDRYIPGVPCWIDTTQPDPEAAAAFYGELFGWQVENVMPPGAPEYHIARLRGEDVAGIARADGPTAAWNTYVWVDSADETADKIRGAGGTVIKEPADVGESGRMAVVADPGGAAFTVWEELLNGGMWALPAYGDFLEQRTPGLRENMRTMGAPDRFEEVVASVAPIPADQPDTFPHWGVTFAVDDADDIAARADKLGGWVVVPPFDAPWVRMTVISDPQGATFTASKFVPENKDGSSESARAATGA
jgi:predicted enzyme related to lactoylglutathione lyase